MSITGRMTVERLEAFGEAWSSGDVDLIMSFLTDDCVYSASVGIEPGETFVGAIEVRRGVVAMLAHDRTAESRGGRCIVLGDIGVAEWSYLLPTDEGEAGPVEVRGCDILEFRGELISRKDAFRKTWPKGK